MCNPPQPRVIQKLPLTHRGPQPNHATTTVRDHHTSDISPRARTELTCTITSYELENRERAHALSASTAADSAPAHHPHRERVPSLIITLSCYHNTYHNTYHNILTESASSHILSQHLVDLRVNFITQSASSSKLHPIMARRP